MLRRFNISAEDKQSNQSKEAKPSSPDIPACEEPEDGLSNFRAQLLGVDEDSLPQELHHADPDGGVSSPAMSRENSSSGPVEHFSKSLPAAEIAGSTENGGHAADSAEGTGGEGPLRDAGEEPAAAGAEETLVSRLERDYSCLNEGFMRTLQRKAPGFRPSFGGEELRRAFAALSGTALLTPMAADNTHKAGKRPPSAQIPLPPLSVREVQDARSRELMFAAKRYSAAFIDNPNDFHAVYNHGLVLQELASVKGRRPADQERLLLEACERYGAALSISRSAHAVLYNWGVALTDLARLAKMNGSAEYKSYLHTAGEKYAAALRWNPRNPQALNNLGLVLQDLAQGLPGREQRQLMAWAAAKFRRAIRQRPDFHRAAYNLGTVYYSHAAALGHHQWPTKDGHSQTVDGAVQTLFQMAAQYVCLAFALEPYKEVYQRSLSVVRAQLPLPYLRTGYLLTIRPDTAGRVQETWVKNWFVLNEISLAEVEAPRIEEHHALRAESLLRQLSSSKRSPAHNPQSPPEEAFQPVPKSAPNLRIPLCNVARVQRCFDPSLPQGGGLWLMLRGSSEGVYLVAENDEDADCWADAILLGAFLVEQRREEALASALRTPRDSLS
uniref:PH domain-containing protein n=1 Tax=Tetraselmis sp. GSL018 TaxID=582737 RepID=A0A061SBL9_9CHLO